MPLVIGATCFQDLQIGDQGEECEDDPLVSDGEVVHIGRERHLEPDLVQELAVRAEGIEDDVASRVAACLIGKREKLVRDGVHFRMRCKRLRANRTIEVVTSERG